MTARSSVACIVVASYAVGHARGSAAVLEDAAAHPGTSARRNGAMHHAFLMLHVSDGDRTVPLRGVRR